jgi:hypothetical protein
LWENPIEARIIVRNTVKQHQSALAILDNFAGTRGHHNEPGGRERRHQIRPTGWISNRQSLPISIHLPAAQELALSALSVTMMSETQNQFWI